MKIEQVPYIKLKEICTVNQGLQIAISKRHREPGINRHFYITIQFLKDSIANRFYVKNPPTSSICTEDDILVVRTGSTGVIIRGYEGCFHNNFFKVNLSTDSYDKDFLYHVLTTSEKKGEMKRRSGITTIPDLNHFMFLDMKVPMLELHVQQEVSNILSTLDKKIDLNNKINAELESMAKLIYDYWFVQFDFPTSAAYAASVGKPEMEGRPYKSSGGKMVWSEELKREIPEGWGVGTISDFIDSEKGGDWGKESIQGNYVTEVKCIRGADLDGLNGRGSMKTPKRYILVKNHHKILESHDLIVEISGGSPTQSTGRLGFVIEETLNRFDSPIICSNFCKAITLKHQHSLFNFKLEWERLYDHGVLFGFEGKTSGIKNLLYDSFTTNYPIVLPDDLVMKSFYLKIMPFYKKQQLGLKENQELSSLRDWLLPMLMNGQVTVKTL